VSTGLPDNRRAMEMALTFDAVCTIVSALVLLKFNVLQIMTRVSDAREVAGS
jgi:hypothetical protein